MQTGLYSKQNEAWQQVVADTTHKVSNPQECYTFYHPKQKDASYLCVADWCTILYFETYAELDGIEKDFCEPGNMLLIRNAECEIHTDGAGGFWMVSFPREFFDVSMSNLIADAPIFYDFVTSKTDHSELLYYTTTNEGEKWIASEMLKKQLQIDDYYTIKNVRLSLALFFTIFHRYHFEDQCISGSTMMTEYKEGQILRYLSDHYPTATLPGTAEAFHYHPNYFSTLFRKLFGCEFSAKLQQIRLERARHLLTTTDMKVDQVRASVGFSEKSYFYRIFRAKYGITPAAFRRKILEEQKKD